jgi:hypothetical protein
MELGYMGLTDLYLDEIALVSITCVLYGWAVLEF